MPHFACAKVPQAIPVPSVRQFDVIPVFLNPPAPGVAVLPSQMPSPAAFEHALKVSCISDKLAAKLGLSVTVNIHKHHLPSVGRCRVGLSLFAQMGRHGFTEISHPVDIITVEVVPEAYLRKNYSPKGTIVPIVLGQDLIGLGSWGVSMTSPLGAVLTRTNQGCHRFP